MPSFLSTFDPDPQTGKSWAITYEQYLAENEDHLREVLETLAKDEHGFFLKSWYRESRSFGFISKGVAVDGCSG